MSLHAVLFRAIGIFFYVSSLIPRLSSLLLTGRVKKESSRAAEGMAQFVCSHDIDELLFHCGKIILLNHDSWCENNRTMQRHKILLFVCSNTCRDSIYPSFLCKYRLSTHFYFFLNKLLLFKIKTKCNDEWRDLFFTWIIKVIFLFTFMINCDCQGNN